MTYGGQKIFCVKCIIVTQHIILPPTLFIDFPLAVIHVLSSTVINCKSCIEISLLIELSLIYKHVLLKTGDKRHL